MDSPKFIKKSYDHATVEARWQQVWLDTRLDTPDMERAKKPFYNLMMFPYPSAEGMHVGNMYAFTGSDIYGRFKRMQGWDVFEPIGLDGFGIHSENYALKVGKNPMDQAKVTEKRFYGQLHGIGAMYDWTRTVNTYDIDYYRWTQWVFVQLFKAGLAYRAKAKVNFCPSCQTVLADEQVVDGACERCKTIAVKKDLEQWFFRITAYADRLLAHIPDLDWSEKVKVAQTNWIGKKEGINITYSVYTEANERVGEITCFTTRPDTNFGATFVVIAPEHAFVTTIPTGRKQQTEGKEHEIIEYVQKAKQKSDQERMAEGKKKTGVDTGLYCLNPLNNIKMPLYISDFVLAGFGSGAVVGVPGHDTRDFEFAQAFHIPVKRVVVGKDGDRSPITSKEQVQEDPSFAEASPFAEATEDKSAGKDGTMINSEFLDGLDTDSAIQKMMDYLEKQGWGKRQTTYHLRDWLISRQRYWGPPIPMIYCKHCAKDNKGEQKDMLGWFSVPEQNLPVALPYIDDYKPECDGIAPLAKHKEFFDTVCPSCGKPAVRETDVSDTFLDSAWYFLRYPSVSGAKKQIVPFDQTITKRWLPVHMYTGGAEHSVLHLLYSRFITMALHDLGLVDFDEPFTKFFAHGLIIKDGDKMSKSRGNVVVPDEYIQTYGADALRMYLMFMGPFSDGGDFRDTGMEGMARFVGRVWRVMDKSIKEKGQTDPLVVKILHKTVKKLTDDIEKRRYNTALAALMECTNAIIEHGGLLGRDDIEKYILLFAPFAPHLTEEAWNRLHGRETYKDTSDSVHRQPWPSYDPTLVEDEMATIVIQINGKTRATLSLSRDDGKDEAIVTQKARQQEKLKAYLSSGIKKTIFVPGKLVNFVV